MNDAPDKRTHAPDPTGDQFPEFRQNTDWVHIRPLEDRLVALEAKLAGELAVLLSIERRLAALEAKLAGELAVLDLPVSIERRIAALEDAVARHERDVSAHGLLVHSCELGKQREVNEALKAMIATSWGGSSQDEYEEKKRALSAALREALK
jgi:hypothetical protein